MGITRRQMLLGAGAVAGGWAASPALAVQAPRGLDYRFVNKTGGKFADADCFWSLDSAKTWTSFARQPAVACPLGNGRIYFRLGEAPRNLDDRRALWDFIEYAYGKDGVWHGNTTQVDAFCIPLSIALGDKKVGITEGRTRLFEAFRREAPKEFQGCLQGDWILSPCRAGFGKGGPHERYFQKYIDDVWALYAREKKTPGGGWTGKVVDGELIFTSGEKSVRCKQKPDSQDAFLGTGVLATNPAFCAAIQRHVLADPADWHDPSKFYRAEPCNAYSKFLHEHSIARKAYGFCYDDFAEQAAFFSGQGDRVVVTLTWD